MVPSMREKKNCIMDEKSAAIQDKKSSLAHVRAKMPKPEDTISPTAIVQALGGKGLTSTFLFKKIARHHRVSSTRPLVDVVRDAMLMKNDIIRDVQSSSRKSCEAAYRGLSKTLAKLMCTSKPTHNMIAVQQSERYMLRKYGVDMSKFKQYLAAQNPCCPYEITYPAAIEWDDTETDPSVQSVYIRIRRVRHPECFTTPGALLT